MDNYQVKTQHCPTMAVEENKMNMTVIIIMMIIVHLAHMAGSQNSVARSGKLPYKTVYF